MKLWELIEKLKELEPVYADNEVVLNIRLPGNPDNYFEPGEIRHVQNVCNLNFDNARIPGIEINRGSGFKR
jgi:hypothetical protein